MRPLSGLAQPTDADAIAHGPRLGIEADDGARGRLVRAGPGEDTARTEVPASGTRITAGLRG
ncbi:hypothetical protein MRF4_14830 [Methylobacterium radiotolerans]